MTEKEMEHEDEIKVKDKRRFTPEGESRTPDEVSGEKQAEVKAEEKKEAEVPSEKENAEEKQSQPEAPKKDEAHEQQLPPLNFANFVLSLATSAQMHMGVIPNPQTGKPETNIRMAKETIDLLDILKEKTKGNLSPEEERLFDHLLYELRTMYVNMSK